MGGSNNSYNIIQEYPKIPQDPVTQNLRYYFRIQFGWHIISLFDLVVFRRKIEPKFYEWLLVKFLLLL